MRDDGSAALTARALTGSGVGTTINLDFGDVLATWRWNTAQAALTLQDVVRLRAGMSLSGLFAPPPVGARFYSNAFYWVANGCRDGQFYFNAWVYPSAGYAALKFPAALLAFDGTGIAPSAPRARHRRELPRRLVAPRLGAEPRPQFRHGAGPRRPARAVAG